ncbi:MAG: threonine--tRNA ligase [Cytophagales bacterium]|nr:threonine--tRNA ligase [Cytophagales bacterium]
MLDMFDDEEYKSLFWHSSAHILAASLKKLYGEDILLGTGPAIKNGFYYDVYFKKGKFDNKNIEDVEREFIKLCNQNDEFIKRYISKSEAMELFKDNPLKQEIIKDLNDEDISIYQTGCFIDLCKGPHLPRSGVIKAVKILNISGAFWRGDEHNQQMTRIYGISFPDKRMLEDYLNLLEESKKRDHVKLSQQLQFFCFSQNVGLGLPLWLPRGTVFRNILEGFLREEQLKRGYKHVMTPHIGNINLYKTSGHYDKYGEDAFKVIKTPNEGEEYMLKPMNCPHHCEIYRSSPRSYRDLPLRLAEFGTVYRYEKHGELNGILRSRSFTQDDAHIFCRKEDVESEISNIIDLIKYVFNKLGFEKLKARLSLHEASDFNRYIGSQEDWLIAEKALEEVASKNDLTIEKAYGEAAFYGPKLDFIVSDVLGRSWQLGTIQLDYQLPARFDLVYTNDKNAKERPVMIHRAPLGSIERITAILLEHTDGRLPVWLAPEQVRILIVANDVLEYASSVFNILRGKGVRVEFDDRNEKLGRKILDANNLKIPYMVIIGQKEQQENLLCVRQGGQQNNEIMNIEDFITLVLK